MSAIFDLARDRQVILALCAFTLLAGVLLLLILRRRRQTRLQLARTRVVLDGSNIMYWRDGTPQIRPVQQVVRHLENCGYTPGVVFDANAGYLISGKYRHDADLGKWLRLPTDRVMVVPKGTPADPFILTAARDMQASIVTNDRFRDWADQFPEVRKPGLLIQGGYRSGKLWLGLDRP